MKTLLYLLAIVVSFYYLNAQDISKPTRLFDATTIPILEKPTTKFVKSWNWWSIDRKLDSAMHINFFHTNGENDLGYMFPINQQRIQQPAKLPNFFLDFIHYIQEI